ncbi:MAG: thioredoxin domain-containing protein [Acidobacteriaceae bacterium]|nr:thioredoxin domain-containing protein [Acidobacteriaceae bacterium]MBV9501209.1 thioredoxin domain-containing protein [Acidobacteriaceae bacterium]
MRSLLFLVVGCGLACLPACVVAQSGPPKLDKAKLEAYLRYAEGYTNQVNFAIDDPTASPFPGYYRVVAHLSMGAQKVDRVYYVTPDGHDIINGSIWNLDGSPFLDTLAHLPANGPSFGSADAKITIVIFSDFQCPYCREFAKTVRDNVPQKYPKDVRVVYEDFPIDAIHQWARAAAEAAHCLAEQKPAAFWAFHDWIFQHQQEVDPSNLREKTLQIAKEQNLDVAAAGSCTDSHATAPIVNRSLEAGRALQIQQTPTVFINGRTISGAVSWATLDTVIQMELNRLKELAETSPGKCCEVAIPKAVKN